MKLWNVKLSVVTLERGETAEEAAAMVARDLARLGIEVYVGDAPDVFEIEDE